MKKTYKFLMPFASLILTACNTLSAPSNAISEHPKGSYRTLSQSTAKEHLDASSDIILLDVRTPEEFEEVRIPSSILIPDYELEKSAPDALPDKEALIYVYCRSGRRSKVAASKLANMGYTNVYDIGGILDWQYETTTGKN